MPDSGNSSKCNLLFMFLEKHEKHSQQEGAIPSFNVLYKVIARVYKRVDRPSLWPHVCSF
jgi:hypothetical protein